MSDTDALLEFLLERLADRIAERLLKEQAQRQAKVGERVDSPWLNAASAAAYLDLPLQRLYKLTAQGAIPHYKQDGRLLFNRQELDHWLTAFRQPGDWISGEFRAISP